ncbi:unnamed protein product [Oncorhynchus mykiss]|uniref:Uncharacterized protein n=1 Tax=Oncorhynchus mykiss TaxID=8022 RepID=A0A060XMK1_ONCMY|nr:unnamed protein product [Oncorhynchus mykiss]
MKLPQFCKFLYPTGTGPDREKGKSRISGTFRPVNDSGDEEPTTQSDRSEGIQGTLKTLISKLDDLSTCNDLIAKHGAALQRSLSELEALRVPVEGGEKIKGVNERATLFRITSNAMINVPIQI